MSLEASLLARSKLWQNVAVEVVPFAFPCLCGMSLPMHVVRTTVGYDAIILTGASSYFSVLLGSRTARRSSSSRRQEPLTYYSTTT